MILGPQINLLTISLCGPDEKVGKLRLSLAVSLILALQPAIHVMPRKQKTTPLHAQKDLVERGEKAEASNLERGLLSEPFEAAELLTDILVYFPSLGSYNLFYSSYCHWRNFRPENFLVRINMLRALSQVVSTIDAIFCHFSGSQSTFVLYERTVETRD